MSQNLVYPALIQAADDFLTANATITTDQGTFENLPVLDSSAIAWENRVFDDTGKGPIASVFVVENNDPATIGEAGFDETTGFLQINLDIPTGAGVYPHMEWNRKNCMFFVPGVKFSYQGNSVVVLSSKMSQGRLVGNHFRKSLTIAFRSHSKRHNPTQ